MPRRAWSLADELSTLAHAVEAARRVAETNSSDTSSSGEVAASFATITGTLGLVGCRLRDLGRVLRGELDPGVLHAPHNAVEPEAVNDAGDVGFRAWGPKRRAAHARRELALAEADLARAKK